MKLSRRDFGRLGLAGLSTAVLRGQEHHHHGASGSAAQQPDIHPAIRMDELRPYVDALRIPKTIKGQKLRLEMREVVAQVHRDLPPTHFWSFGDSFPGPTIEAMKGHPLQVEWANRLPSKHFLPIDHNLHGAESSVPDVRAVVHIHGAKVPPQHDGYPEAWYVPGKSQTYLYPNEQDAAMLWYHDHTMGINRLNVYAGLFGAYILRDETESALQLPTGEFEIPLIFCDRLFGKDGQLYYPVSGVPDNPWNPEFEGDALVINGKLFPYANLKAATYRLRILNASNSRFLSLELSNQQEFVQIGSDQGLLSKPVHVKTLNLAPAERADILLDLTDSHGAKIELMNGVLPVMEFRVGARASSPKVVLPQTLREIPRIPESEAVTTRMLSLSEVIDDYENVTEVLLNNSHWHDPVTEKPVLNTTEIWAFANTTDDAHPIHLHLVRFQVLDRRPFNLYQFLVTGKVEYTGPAIPPEPGEEGWKDTVRAFGGMVTRIITRFEGYAGRYVWHCHILEHEDNDMMRPFEIIAPNG